MRVFAIGIEYALDVTVQCPHDADPRALPQDQALHCRLSFCGRMLSLRKLGGIAPLVKPAAMPRYEHQIAPGHFRLSDPRKSVLLGQLYPVIMGVWTRTSAFVFGSGKLS
jgi:hypothetical protein